MSGRQVTATVRPMFAELQAVREALAAGGGDRRALLGRVNAVGYRASGLPLHPPVRKLLSEAHHLAAKLGA